MNRVELTRFMNGARVVQIVDYATYAQWTAHNPHDPRPIINNVRIGEEVGFFHTRLVKVGQAGFGAWFKEHAS